MNRLNTPCSNKTYKASTEANQGKYSQSATKFETTFDWAIARSRQLVAGSALGIGLLTGGVVSTIALEAAVTTQSVKAQSALTNPEIKVGIVQRFGEKKTDKLILAPLSGDQLTIGFETSGQAQTVNTNRLQIDIAMQPLATPMLQEWVVLSTHRSFESAEDSALRWRAAGIEAEIAQPNAWQVWAKRDVYSTPLLRRLLLDNLHSEGYTRAYIDSRVVKEIPKVAFTTNGYRYVRDEFTITSANRRIQMAHNSDRLRDLYAGDMKVQPNSYGDFTLVNQVPIEQYLRGVVPHEIGASAPRPAIEAQAILARTYALRNLRRFEIDNYEMCADTQCQVYFGLADVDPGTDQAIAATTGQVLTYNNELVDALYSSTTGGITARFTDVWNGEDRPYLKPVIDSLQAKWDIASRPLSDEANFRAFINLNSGFNEVGWPLFRWNNSATLKDIGTTMKEYLSKRQHPLAGFNQITGLAVVERAPSGRVQKIQVDTDLGSFDLIKDEAVKALVPPRSLLFYIEPFYETQTKKTAGATADTAGEPKPVGNIENKLGDAIAQSKPTETQPTQPTRPVLKGYRFIGGGFGHGVGMSQTGAYNLGKQGYSSRQILEFYYPGTKLKSISPSTVFWNDQ